MFSFSNDMPYRIELYGDEIESIRVFNPIDQLSVMKVDWFYIHEFCVKAVLEALRF